MSFRNPLYMQNSTKFSYAAVDDRFVIDTLFAEGILNVPAGQGLVIQRPAGAAMNVRVPAFDSIIKGDDATNQGSYLVRMDVTEDIDIPAANATNPRIDLIVAEVVDGSYRTIATGGFEGSRLRVVAGTAAASPVAPTLPATAIPLAQIAVAQNATSITTANITDARVASGGGSGAIGAAAQPLTATQIAALATAAKYQGRLIENTTTGKLQHVTAAGATPVDVATAGLKAQGTFTGDGTSGRTIAVGFTPDLVLVYSSAASGAAQLAWVTRTDQLYTQSARLVSPTAFSTEALSATGFVVTNLNGSGTSYAWSAFKFS